jgi:polyphosphate glucokinase
VRKVIALLDTVINYDALYIGGGNARLIDSQLPAKVKTVSNEAGVTGGVRLWDRRMDHFFAQRGFFDA